MELTRTDAVFSRIALVLFLCRNKSSWIDLKIYGEYFWNIVKILAKESTRGDPPAVHKGGGPPLGHAPCLVGPRDLHRPQIQLHIFTFGGKIREKDSSHFTIGSRCHLLIFTGRADLEPDLGSEEGK